MITITTGTAFWSAALFLVGGVALLGFVKMTFLDGLLKVVSALEHRVKQLEEQLAAAQRDLGRLKAEGELKTRQLAVSLRVIEYFERVITTVIKGRVRMPGDLVEQIDAGLRELAEFRRQASLDLESLAINREHYDWLLAREAIMGPDRNMGPDRDTETRNTDSHSSSSAS